MVSTVFVLVSLWIAVLAISFEQGFPWVEESLVATASVVVLTVVHLFVLAVEFAVAVVVGETSDWGVVVDSCCLVVSGVMDAMVVFVVAGIAGSIAEVVVDCTVFAVVEWAYFYLQFVAVLERKNTVYLNGHVPKVEALSAVELSVTRAS